MKIAWLEKLQHGLQSLGFSLGVATVIYAFAPNAPYLPNAIYSVSIGTTIWAIIDLGRHLFPSADETGWPQGWRGGFLVAVGIGCGFITGTLVTDAIGRSLGWFTGPRMGDLRIALLITALSGVAATFYFYSRGRSAYLDRKLAETREHAEDARLKLLEAQLEPHMLFNTLANLRALIAVDPARAQVMLDHMIAYLRATLAGSRATTHTLETEFERLRDYLELMAIRMGPRLRYTLDLPPQLAARKVPTLLLQPIVENALQHGLEPKIGGGEIRVAARAKGAALVIEVKDTGVGSAPAPSAGKGFGLAQVRDRLAALYGEAGRFEFDTRPGEGARATITIP